VRARRAGRRVSLAGARLPKLRSRTARARCASCGHPGPGVLSDRVQHLSPGFARKNGQPVGRGEDHRTANDRHHARSDHARPSRPSLAQRPRPLPSSRAKPTPGRLYTWRANTRKLPTVVLGAANRIGGADGPPRWALVSLCDVRHAFAERNVKGHGHPRTGSHRPASFSSAAPASFVSHSLIALSARPASINSLLGGSLKRPEALRNTRDGQTGSRRGSPNLQCSIQRFFPPPTDPHEHGDQ